MEESEAESKEGKKSISSSKFKNSKAKISTSA